MTELAQMLVDQAQAGGRMMLAGIQAERNAMRPRLSALVAAYDRAKADPKTVIPSYLEVLIESFRADLVNEYANVQIKRDQEKPDWLRNVLTGGRDIPNGR
jgi:hypothetical protein